jgi:hypothetical protein
MALGLLKHPWSGQVQVELDGRLLHIENLFSESSHRETVSLAVPSGGRLRFTVTPDTGSRGSEAWIYSVLYR